MSPWVFGAVVAVAVTVTVTVTVTGVASEKAAGLVGILLSMNRPFDP
jgi:uncharacterized membrane protein YgaE (UPF0421/DUF939 family)